MHTDLYNVNLWFAELWLAMYSIVTMQDASSKLWFWVRMGAIFGIALSIYLLAEQWFQPEFRPCTINSTINCDAIIDGPVAKTFGIPTPLYGLTGYTIILIASFKKWKKLAMGMATFGLGFCLWIGYKELVELHVVCPVCIMCQVTMIGVFGLMWKIVKR